MGQVTELLDPYLRWADMGSGKVGNGFVGGKAIRRQAEGVDYICTEQIGVTESEGLG